MKLSEVAVSRPVFTTMMMAALLVLGAFSYTELAVDLFPNIDFPITTVQTVYKGASAETLESEVTTKIEDAVNQISGIKSIESQSREGYSLIVIQFELEKNGYQATQEVREKLAGIRADLPDDIDEPIVQNYDPGAEPILSLAVFGDRPPREITQITKDIIKKRLETVSGVGSVELVGGQEREILLAIDPHLMESYNVSVADVRNAVSAANLEIPGGRVDESSREYLVRMAGRLNDVSQFNHIVVKNKRGAQITLADIATVMDTTVEQRSFSSFNGQSAVSLTITKQSGTNTVEMADKVKKVITQLKDELPRDIDIQIVDDRSTFIQDSIHEILFNIEFGTLLAILVIYLFLLNWRPTIITGLAIPISIISAFTVMKALGFTINVMTLLGLSLAVGILIDDAIVVIENIFRHMSEGRTPWEAAISGTKEIGLAVMATTFSIVVVFLPVAFMQGIVGRFFYQFGVVVAVAVMASLFVAFSLTPMLSARLLREETDPRQSKSAFKRAWGAVRHKLGYWDRAFDAVKPVYERLLAASLRHRWVVILLAIASFGLAFVAAQFVGVEFFNETDENKLAIDIKTPPGTDLQKTIEQFRTTEKIVRGLPQVTNTFITIGRGNDPVTDGRLLVKLVDRSERDLSARQLMDSCRTLLADVPGMKVAISRGEGRAGSQKPIEISIRGPNMNEITRMTREVERITYQTPGAVDIDNTAVEGKPELNVTIDRRLADDLGLNLMQIPMTVRSLVEGDVVTKYKEGDEDYDVRMRLAEQYRSSATDIGRILIQSDKDQPGGGKLLVPLDRVARLEKTTAIGQYNRYNRQREVRVSANVTSDAFAGSVANQILARATKEIQVPPGYVIGTVGQQEMMAESFANILKALLLAVIFIYLLLASQYESFSDPFSIMLSLPLSLVGAILGLIGSSFSIMSLIGIVLLMGLVTKNAILLIDFVKQERNKGVPRTDAVLSAGPIRLRPILMTTLATVFGMLPLALGLGPGAELRAPMARAVIGGMLSSMLLTLVVVPVVYTLIDDFVGLFRRKKAPQGTPNKGIAQSG